MSQHLTNIRVDAPRFDPDWAQVRIQFDAVAAGFATLIVFDADGRAVLHLRDTRIRQGANTLIWHGHDADGWPLPEGVYTLAIYATGLDRRPAAGLPLRCTLELRRDPSGADPPGASRSCLAFPTGYARAPLPLW